MYIDCLVKAVLALSAAFLLTSPLFAQGQEQDPAFAGTVIAFSGQNAKEGHLESQIYLAATRFNGFYDSNGNLNHDRNIHQYAGRLEFYYGITPHIEVLAIFQDFLIHNNGEEAHQFGDIALYFGFQILKEKKDVPIPSARLLIGEIFPTGEYKNLEVIFRGADGVGDGSLTTVLAFILSETYPWKYPFNWTVNVFYYLPTRVNIKGPNVYINEPNIRGQIVPGVQIGIDFSFELKFNKPWGIGLDVYFQQQNSSSFHNRNSGTGNYDIPSFHLLSVVPCVQYNCNKNLSTVAGIWLSVMGRNTVAFTTYVFSVFYIF